MHNGDTVKSARQRGIFPQTRRWRYPTKVGIGRPFEQAGGASPSPTLNDIVCAFKSLTSRLCKQKCRTGKLFQRSYYDHIIRNDRDLDEHIRYILENPLNWQLDELYSEE